MNAVKSSEHRPEQSHGCRNTGNPNSQANKTTPHTLSKNALFLWLATTEPCINSERISRLLLDLGQRPLNVLTALSCELICLSRRESPSCDFNRSCLWGYPQRSITIRTAGPHSR
ncbi:hypothetical protein AOLI_G00131010 [Acnodon oligacanthus]